MERFIKGNSKILVIAFIIISILILSTYIINTGYAVKFDNKVIGIVKSKNDVISLVSDIKESYKIKLNKEIEMPQSITYERVFKIGADKLSKEEIRIKVEENIDINVEAYILNIDGQDFGILDNKQQIDVLLNNIKSRYINEEDVEIKDLRFVENISVKKVYVNPNKIKSIDELNKLIDSENEEVKTYEIKEGDTIWDVSKKYDISIQDISRLNPDINVDSIKIGQIVNFTVPRSVLNVTFAKKTKYEDKIPYEKEYEESNNLYKGDSKVKIKGNDGKKEVLVEIVYINGIEEKRNIIEEKILEEPKTEVLLKGTKDRPKTLAYGEFTEPTRGYLTSRFGARWGSTHRGIDIGVSKGTANKAADGGKVIFSGWKGNYGNLVIIDHENGYQTYYAHNSVLKVKKGQRVYRGQVIALSGATGRVTGPHLHFEVRKNGKPVNPLSFVTY